MTHLYVLVPVLDDGSTIGSADDEIEKLMRRGEGGSRAPGTRRHRGPVPGAPARPRARAIGQVTAEEHPEEEALAAQKDAQEAASSARSACTSGGSTPCSRC